MILFGIFASINFWGIAYKNIQNFANYLLITAIRISNYIGWVSTRLAAYRYRKTLVGVFCYRIYDGGATKRRTDGCF